MFLFNGFRKTSLVFVAIINRRHNQGKLEPIIDLKVSEICEIIKYKS